MILEKENLEQKSTIYSKQPQKLKLKQKLATLWNGFRRVASPREIQVELDRSKKIRSTLEVLLMESINFLGSGGMVFDILIVWGTQSEKSPTQTT